MSVKNKLNGLLFTTLLLTACATEEANPAEEGGMGGVTEEELQHEVAVDEVAAEEEGTEVTFESVQDVYLHPSIDVVDRELPEIDSIQTDTADIAGVYHSYTQNPSSEESFEFPKEEWLEVNEDGTYTKISYSVLDISRSDVNGVPFVENTLETFINELDGMKLMEMIQMLDSRRWYPRDNGHRALYLNNNNEVQLKEGGNITVGDVKIDSGYLAAEYGEFRYVPVDRVEINAKYNSDGEVFVSDLFNQTYDDVESSKLSFSGGSSVSEESFDVATLSEASVSELTISDFVRDGKLKSAHQVQTDLNIMNADRIANESESHDQLARPFLYSDAELYLLGNHRIGYEGKVISDTSHLKGYMKDNTEFQPDIAFEWGTIYALNEDNLILEFNKNDNTWGLGGF